MNANEKTRRLSAQWPKKCGCGLVYTRKDWRQLPIAYNRADEYSTNEARHCSCGSTLEVMREIHDLAKE